MAAKKAVKPNKKLVRIGIVSNAGTGANFPANCIRTHGWHGDVYSVEWTTETGQDVTSTFINPAEVSLFFEEATDGNAA